MTKHIPWNKGKTKETDERLNNASKKLKYKYANNILINNRLGTHHNSSSKKKISDAMKIARDKGKTWNVGTKRWNRKQSYPEEFFTKVIQNEFNNKNYISELRIGRYSLDFAWEDIKKCIEIDGGQHYQFQDYIDRDKRKDLYLKEHGWKCLRIPWKLMYNDSKYWIEVTKNFIHDDNYICPIIEFDEENLPIFDKKYFEKKKINEDQIEKEKQMVEDLINNSNIDFTKNGWKKLSSEYLGISISLVNRILTSYNIEFYNSCYIISNRLINIDEKKIEILNSNIDFSVWGWNTKVSKILNISPNKVTNWMRKNMYDFYITHCKIKKNNKDI